MGLRRGIGLFRASCADGTAEHGSDVHVFPSGAAEAPRILGPVWGTVRGSARRLKPHSTLSAGASVGDQGLRKKCGHLFLFSLQSAGGECKVPVVGQARERVRLQKELTRASCSHLV